MSTLESIRKRLGLNQQQMALMLDVSKRAYQDMENGVTKARQSTIDAAEYRAMLAAVTVGDPNIASPTTIEAARNLTKMIDDASVWAPLYTSGQANRIGWLHRKTGLAHLGQDKPPE